MGQTLASAGRKRRDRLRARTVLVLGVDGAGKTSIVKNITSDDALSVTPTLGVNRKTLVKPANPRARITFVDPGGGAPSRGTWPGLFREAHALIFVIDASDRRRLQEAGDVLARLLRAEALAGKPLLVMANKCDSIGSVSSKELSDGFALHSLRDRAWQVQACSARYGDGLSAGISWLLRTLYGRSIDKTSALDEAVGDNIGSTSTVETKRRESDVKRMFDKAEKETGADTLAAKAAVANARKAKARKARTEGETKKNRKGKEVTGGETKSSRDNKKKVPDKATREVEGGDGVAQEGEGVETKS
jgi:ADP-ribosylation factor-like protein 3